LLKLKSTKHKFIKFSKQLKKKAKIQSYYYLAACAKAAWQKYKKYYIKADDTAAYYAAIIFNPTLKMQWFYD
jgi:hypothetical protein